MYAVRYKFYSLLWYWQDCNKLGVFIINQHSSKITLDDQTNLSLARIKFIKLEVISIDLFISPSLFSHSGIPSQRRLSPRVSKYINIRSFLNLTQEIIKKFQLVTFLLFIINLPLTRGQSYQSPYYILQSYYLHAKLADSEQFTTTKSCDYFSLLL